MDNEAWHQRFVFQVFWTKKLRYYLYRQLNLSRESKILDVGCGTGALLAENLGVTPYTFGIDIDYSRCAYAHTKQPDAHIASANAYFLPFQEKSFDLTFCNYLLLWIDRPIEVLTEMRRVTKINGSVIAFAEPDYESRIDYPSIFEKIGQFQNKSLSKQGVRCDTGRRLRSFFHQAGFTNVTTGMLSGEWNKNQPDYFSMEWEMIAHDLRLILSERRLNNLEQEARKAWLNDDAFSFIPTFYAIGCV